MFINDVIAGMTGVQAMQERRMKKRLFLNNASVCRSLNPLPFDVKIPMNASPKQERSVNLKSIKLT